MKRLLLPYSPRLSVFNCLWCQILNKIPDNAATTTLVMIDHSLTCIKVPFFHRTVKEILIPKVYVKLRIHLIPSRHS